MIVCFSIDMWPFRSPKQLPVPVNEGVSADIREQLDTLNEFFERVQQAERDITNLNTAINRVERKQSRWLEVLNEREDPAMLKKLEGLVPGDGVKQPAEVGEETMNIWG